MPVFSSGMLPGTGTNVANELQAVTRRAFIPKLIVQNIYFATPILSSLLANAEPVSGGVSPITAPVQGQPLTQTSTTGYDGSFTAPTLITGIQNAEFNLCSMVTPIPFYVMEGLAQINAAVIPIIEARMNDAGNSITNYLANVLMTGLQPGGGALTTQDIWAFTDIISTTNPTRGNFGNISRTTNTFWQATVSTITAITGNTSLTRNNVQAGIIKASKGGSGEMPTFGILGPGSWLTLSQDFIGSERYNITPERAFSEAEDGARAAFTALMVAGVPIYMDLLQPEGTLTLLNTSYLQFKIHQDAAFAVAGPESLLPNMQLAYIMVLVTLLQTVCTKPSAQCNITGFTGFATV